MKKHIFYFAAALVAGLLLGLAARAANIQISMSGSLEAEYGFDGYAELYFTGGIPQVYLSMANPFDYYVYWYTDFFGYVHYNPSPQCGAALSDGRVVATGSTDMECGNIYLLTVDGTPCGPGMYVSFAGAPPGYMLEFNPLTLPPGVQASPFDNAHQVSTEFDLTDWQVQLKPKLIHFFQGNTRVNSLSPDGLEQAQAKVSFMTGSNGDWFTGSPVWSIVGDNLGCTINATTGVIQAGTVAGEITVMATDAGGTGHFLSGALKTGCASCAAGNCGLGWGSCANATNALTLGMGILPDDGSFMGSIRLKLTAPAPALTTPAGLIYNLYSTDNGLPQIVTNSDGSLRQVSAPECLADVVTITGGYDIRVYAATNAGPFTNGVYHPVSGTAIKDWRVHSLAGDYSEFAVIEDPTDAVAGGKGITNTFTWSINDNAWTLNRSGVSQED